MRHLTADRPKPLVPVLGRTLIDRTLDRVTEAGIDAAVVNLHYHPAMLRAHLAGRKVIFSDETDELLETGGGVAKALPLLGDRPFMVVNSDNVWLGKNALLPLVEAWDAAAMDALLLLVPVERAIGYSRAGDFSLDGGRLVRRGEAARAPLVFTGAQILSPALFDDVPEGPFSLNLVWDRAIAAGRAFGIGHPGGWCDVGTPEGLSEAEDALR
jgi:MurNAc alpha-1-phosphate uridylyltransferase